jgi:hypothetical protein
MGVWGQGSLRERRSGVFEIRIAVGVDPVSGRTVQRSFWFHGALEDAEERRSELASQFAEYRAVRRAAPFLTVGELLERWMAAHHDWAAFYVELGPVQRQGAHRGCPRRQACFVPATRSRPPSHGQVEGDGRQRVRRVGSVPGAPFVRRLGTVGIDHRPQSDQRHAGAAPPRHSHARAWLGTSPH